LSQAYDILINKPFSEFTPEERRIAVTCTYVAWVREDLRMYGYSRFLVELIEGEVYQLTNQDLVDQEFKEIFIAAGETLKDTCNEVFYAGDLILDTLRKYLDRDEPETHFSTYSLEA